jgi:hypothetical protein
VERLNRVMGENANAEPLRSISEQINGLARMIDEMLDVENPRGETKRS